MSDRQSPVATCYYCGNTYTNRGMARHLKACDARQAAIEEANAQEVPKTRIFHLAIKGSDVHRLHVEVPGDASLENLDQFLRDIWVECCGHLSQFTIDDVNYTSLVNRSWFPDDRGMDVELGEVLYPKLRFSYEYDFGTPTYLKLRVVSERKGVLPGEDVVHVMARNQLPDYRCEVCGKPATVLCVFCDYPLLCDECYPEHECGEEGLMPVVNSPRMGVCGYTGDAW